GPWRSRRARAVGTVRSRSSRGRGRASSPRAGPGRGSSRSRPVSHRAASGRSRRRTRRSGVARGRQLGRRADAVAARKQEHLDLCLRGDVESAVKTTLLEEVELVHDAVPDLALDGVDTSTRWLGKRLAAPLLITSMTGGTAEAFRVNRDLARVAEEAG